MNSTPEPADDRAEGAADAGPPHPGQPGPPNPGQPGPPYPGYPGPPYPGYPGPPYLGYPPPRQGIGFGGWVGIGVAIGVGLQVLAVVLMLLSAGLGIDFVGVWGLLWPFALVAVAAIAMMFFRKTRGAATGILIVAAATFLIVIGPCIAMLSGF
ncbi:MAG: hypothetical protein QM602_03285 [Microbacterium sp.]